MDALIDADSLLYKVGFTLEEKVIWNEPEWLAGFEAPVIEYYTDSIRSLYLFDKMVDNILFATDCDSAYLVFSGEGNFRLDLPTEYKGNRAASRKPINYDQLLDHALENYTAAVIDGMEADDFVVYLKTSKPEDYILCAIDKDVLFQTEGTHYNYHNDSNITVTKEEAIYYAYYQTLTGDTVDGYKGCPNIGPVKAKSILKGLKTEKEMWDAVVKTYEDRGLTFENALWTMRLANMHQYNGEKIVLWNPPES